MSLYHKTLKLNLILYSSEITDIIQLILLCYLHVAPLFKDISYSSLISVVTTHSVWETYWKVFTWKTRNMQRYQSDGSKGNMLWGLTYKPCLFNKFFIIVQVMEHQKVGLSEHDELKDMWQRSGSGLLWYSHSIICLEGLNLEKLLW